MESLLSPTLAAALLTIITYNWLFVGTVVGFLCSAGLVLSVTVPQREASGRDGGLYDNTTRGMRIYLATPRLRGLLALNLSVAAAGAMVIVNTVVLVKGLLDGTDRDVALALACFGGGSTMAALVLPRLLDRMADRAVMLPSAGMLGTALLGFAGMMSWSGASALVWPTLLSTWTLLGIAYSAVMMPSGRLLRRSARAADRTAAFAFTRRRGARASLRSGATLYPLSIWHRSDKPVIGDGDERMILHIRGDWHIAASVPDLEARPWTNDI
jgi:hypothetical protein